MKRFRPMVRSKNHSCNDIRRDLGSYPFKSIVRFGSLTPTNEIYPNQNVVEINTVDAIQNSRSKLLMKECFVKAGVPQSVWYLPVQIQNQQDLEYPILLKKVFGFKGHGMVKINNDEELQNWLANNSLDGYYGEHYHSFAREYRLHCTKLGCFYAARKMLKEDTPEDKRWFRNDSNCIWVAEYKVIKDGDNIIGYDEKTPNEAFDKPVNWNKIEEDCVKALNEVGLSIGAFDVKVQSAKDANGIIRQNPEYIIIEVNSAPSFGDITLRKYRSIIPKLLNSK